MKLHLVCLLLFLHAILASFTFNHYDPYGVPLPDDYETVTCVVDNDCATAVGRLTLTTTFFFELGDRIIYPISQGHTVRI